MNENEFMAIVTTMRGFALIAAIIMFGKLAVQFNQWWIALFSLLFMYSVKWKSANEQEGKEDNDERKLD